MSKEDRYSRQIGTYGMETMKKLGEFKVFIFGLRGLGVEIAKNSILIGVKEVTICDDTVIKINDLSSNYILKEEDVGKISRSKACLNDLKKLNNYVEVNNYVFSDLNNFYKKIEFYDIVIITEIIDSSTIDEIENICRKNNHGFIYTGVLGLFSFIFDDFGENHSIYNWNGSTPNIYYIKNISNEKECVITIDDSNDLLLPNEGDYVTFKEIEGIEELNNKIIKIKSIKSKNSFVIEEDTTSYGKYIKNGICIEKKVEKKLSYSSFKKNLINPIIDENIQCENIPTIHSLIYTTQNFFDEKKFLPELNNEEHSKIIFNEAKEFYEMNNGNIKINGEEDDLDQIFNEELALELSKFISAEISPYTTFIGGIVSQEIVKLSGNYTPLNQWFYFEAYDTISNLQSPNRTLLNSRYDDQIAIYGQEIQKRLSKSNLFMVGAGALGCEYLKIFALMGISTDKNSRITVTDNDSIEVSNLNRQFLFNTELIGKSKSECACSAVKAINKNFNCEAHKNLVCTETEKIYNENFFEKQNFLISAVDNNKARNYLDSQAILFKKPLLDAGTEGTKANTILVIPNLTGSLSEIRKDKPNNQYTSCTLKSFPSLIEHCVEWGKILFEKLFISDIQELIDLITDEKSKLEKINDLTNFEKISFLNDVKENLVLLNTNKYENCLKMAFKLFYYHFVYKIQKLLKNNPIDLKNQDGTFFWTGSKRMPEIINFDLNDKLCKDFIFSFANIIARCLGIDIIKDIKDELLIKLNEKIKSNYEQNNKIEEKEDNKNENEEDEENNQDNNTKKDDKEGKQIINLINSVKSLLKEINPNKKITPEIFDKDNDLNGQIKFIYCFSNLRARNYKINECDFLKVKFIAGRIIPAIESTTAAVTGFNSSQIFSLLINEKIENFTEIQMDLGTSFFSYHYPLPKKLQTTYEKKKKKYIAKPNGWTIWDSINLKGPMTLKSFMNFFEKKYEIKIRGIYTKNMEQLMNKKLIDDNIEDIYCKCKNINKDAIRNILDLTLDACDNNKNIILLPSVVYNF